MCIHILKIKQSSATWWAWHILYFLFRILQLWSPSHTHISSFVFFADWPMLLNTLSYHMVGPCWRYYKPPTDDSSEQSRGCHTPSQGSSLSRAVASDWKGRQSFTDANIWHHPDWCNGPLLQREFAVGDRLVELLGWAWADSNDMRSHDFLICDVSSQVSFHFHVSCLERDGWPVSSYCFKRWGPCKMTYHGSPKLMLSLSSSSAQRAAVLLLFMRSPGSVLFTA